jgi:sensor histidine kinase YesM
MDENKVKGLLSNTKSGSVGIKNINERLKHYFGTQLVIQSAPGQGTTVSYKITVEASHEPSGNRMYRSDV